MKVILTQEVPSLGQPGEVKQVADGYASNYLIPQGLAVRATPGALSEQRKQREIEARREARMAARAEALAEELSGVTLMFEAKAGEKGRLYGSITHADIADALEREIGEKFDRRKHILSEPIRQVGKHTIQVRLRADVIADVDVVVKPEEGELPEESETEAEAPAE